MRLEILKEGIPFISCSTVCSAVARSITSSKTLATEPPSEAGFPSEFSPTSLDCCRSAILVPSGIPGMSFSAIALSNANDELVSKNHLEECSKVRVVLDFPVPLRPTRAYRWPSFSLNLALVRISMPSAFALPLLFAVDLPLALLPEVTVMEMPSMSSCGSPELDPGCL